jgi:Bacterial Ig-like domain
VWIAVAIAVALVPWASHAQISRVATTTAALRASPVFFHGKQVAVLGTTTPMRDVVRLDDPGATPDATPAAAAASQTAGRGIYVYFRERPTRSNGELRGEFWDLGRLTEGDTRFSAYDFRPLLEAVTQGRWPGRDQVFVILGASLIDEHLPTTPTLRSIALAPARYENKGVTVSGRFRGRNLFGDLAGPLSSPSKYDFVVQSADAALWVTGIRPRGKGFELDPGARVDTGRWIQVEGTVRRDASRSWIEAREIELTSAPQETATPVEVEVPITPPEPPPTVVFSSPVADEPDVETTTVVRVQFSRDMDSRSFKDRIRVGYVTTPQATDRGPAPPSFSFAYNVGSRGVEVKFASPLERFQTVRVELLEGIKTIDGDAFPPWTLTFVTGGR